MPSRVCPVTVVSKWLNEYEALCGPTLSVVSPEGNVQPLSPLSQCPVVSPSLLSLSGQWSVSAPLPSLSQWSVSVPLFSLSVVSPGGSVRPSLLSQWSVSGQSLNECEALCRPTVRVVIP